MQTPKQMAASQRRKIARMVRELIAMGDEWEDVDHYLESILHTQAHELAKIEKDIQVADEGNE